jgi:hypothetical protein
MSPAVTDTAVPGLLEEHVVVPMKYHDGEDGDANSDGPSESGDVSRLSFTSAVSETSNLSRYTAKDQLMSPRIRQLKLRSKMRLSKVKALLDTSLRETDEVSLSSVKEKASMKDELKRLKKSVNSLEDKHMVTHERNEQLLERNRELEEALRELRREKKEVDQKYRGVRRLMRSIEQDANAVNDVLESNDDLTIEMKEMENKMDKLRLEMDQKQLLMERQTVRLVQLSTALEESKDQEFTLKAELGAENSELREQITRLEADVVSENIVDAEGLDDSRKVDLTSTEKEELSKELEYYKNLAASVQEENARLTSDLQEANQKLQQSGTQGEPAKITDSSIRIQSAADGLVGEFINISERSQAEDESYTVPLEQKLGNPLPKDDTRDSIMSVSASTLDSTERYFFEEPVVPDVDVMANVETSLQDKSDHQSDMNKDSETNADEGEGDNQKQKQNLVMGDRNRRRSSRSTKRQSGASRSSTSSGPDAYFDAHEIKPGSYIVASPYTVVDQSDFLADALQTRERSFWDNMFFGEEPEAKAYERLHAKEDGFGGFLIATIEDDKEQSDFVKEATTRRNSRFPFFGT